MRLENFVEVRRAGSVKRFHTVPTIGEQTLAAHQWGVATILIYILPDAGREAILAALTHDVAELRYGDVPSPAKHASLKLAEACEDLELAELSRLGVLQTITSEEEAQAIKQADLLELLWYCLEQRRLGNTNMNEIFARGVEYINGLPLLDRAKTLLSYIMQEYGRQ